MPTKYLAITIAGAVSLGSYEAGATYEILDAIRQHNDDPRTKAAGDFICVDVLTGASAGGMTAAILAQKLLYAKDAFVDGQGKSSPYDNPLYNTWVKGISLAALLDTVDKPVPLGDPAELSLLSSNLIAKIAHDTLAEADATGQIPVHGGAHNAVDLARGIQLGLALTNLNGVNYAHPMFGGGQFLYTDFSDQMLRGFSPADRALAPWQEISQAAVACGAFPIAFRTKQLTRAKKDFLPSDTLVWPGQDDVQFTYTDGGVLQNQPLGMAKNLVDLNDEHLNNEQRFYLFVSPSALLGNAKPEIEENTANMLVVGKRLVDVYMGQSVFRDWIQALEINKFIDLLDGRAKGLADALEQNEIAPETLTTASQQVLSLLFRPEDKGESQPDAEKRLAHQFAEEIRALGGLPAPKAVAFVKGILALEKTAGLGERDKMTIYGVVADKKKLAGAGIAAFVGFFDQAFRDHDYDFGRTVAQALLANADFGKPGELGPIRYTPAQINPINENLNGLALNKIPKGDVKTLKDGLTKRLNSIIGDLFPNPLEHYPAQLGADLLLGWLLDWEFSRKDQGV